MLRFTDLRGLGIPGEFAIYDLEEERFATFGAKQVWDHLEDLRLSLERDGLTPDGVPFLHSGLPTWAYTSSAPSTFHCSLTVATYFVRCPYCEAKGPYVKNAVAQLSRIESAVCSNCRKSFVYSIIDDRRVRYYV